MVISSVLVKCMDGTENALLVQLKKIEGVSVEAVINGDIILVIESESANASVQIIETGIQSLPGVVGVYPVYIHMDADFLAKGV
ncbi:uncharacterized protein involved in formation of periplasmic nitrate reductase [Desulfitobacterium dichloroeliminans LMG P-21439]|uniref:Uncharacterized protein involved in formation of periplasmic nitrate reductase n=1 Tax=Desulfitobacterium dichloroeliminans (strain LMG P-21439 / DCA1) TaxID=871963 RepID=L0F5T8_DESDL|nr:chaperone NapD [Desulfitobacterium dichloroeliminans]AGA68527.1 uncharacterized protein involved in formation of periplasmic nitrate reductase [Desulfitobacterium dichloroeliminans LMG P-21439]